MGGGGRGRRPDGLMNKGTYNNFNSPGSGGFNPNAGSSPMGGNAEGDFNQQGDGGNSNNAPIEGGEVDNGGSQS